jgi:hypothetical protein
MHNLIGRSAKYNIHSAQIRALVRTGLAVVQFRWSLGIACPRGHRKKANTAAATLDPRRAEPIGTRQLYEPETFKHEGQ